MAEDGRMKRNFDSDSDDSLGDDDPDNIEVPGGGSSLGALQRSNSDPMIIGDFRPTPGPSASIQQYTTRLPLIHNQPEQFNPDFANLLASNGLLMKFINDYDNASLANIYSQLIGAAATALTSDQPVQSTSTPPMKWPDMTPDQDQVEEDAHGDEDNLVVAETFSDYKPSKLNIGKRHPDPIVETASLASVDPPDIYYKLALPSKIIDNGLLSALQLEAVVYACQQHEHFLSSGERAGFLIGDGAGVGKGRTIAGIIYENYLRGRKKSLWISVSADLKFDSARDLNDIGAKVPIHILTKYKYGDLDAQLAATGEGKTDGVLFLTYSALIGNSTSMGKYNTRVKQIKKWCGSNFDGVIVFDECHRAKNLIVYGERKSTRTANNVVELQRDLPKARIVYASATGASEPRHMAYMSRIGIWGPGTPFKDLESFLISIDKRGIGAMEILAMDLKLRGAYIARQLSFKGTSFTIEEVSLAKSFVEVYDECVKLWVEAMNMFIEAMILMACDKRSRQTMWGQFWASHQRFFKYLCIAAKVQKTISISRDAIKWGKCVVIGLQSTGEARTLDQLEKDDGELTDFVSTARGVFTNLIEKHFPASSASKISNIMDKLNRPSEAFREILDAMEVERNAKASSSKRKSAESKKNAAKKIKVVSISDDDSFSDSSISEPNSPETNNGVADSKFLNSAYLPGISTPEPPPVVTEDAMKRCREMKKTLLARIESLSERLPPNTLDQLIDELGGTDDVAEMTGRKGRVIQTEGGNIVYQMRSEGDNSVESINVKEKERFMSGKKKIAIISEAASSGISLHSDRRVENKLRRIHITLELPWSADRAIQQFGRTHRSNQVNGPEYIFLISNLAGENRFASIVAKRLESLGALTHADRRANESRDLSRFNIDTKFGTVALEHVMKTVMGLGVPVASVPSVNPGEFFHDARAALIGVGLIVNNKKYPGTLTVEKEATNMSKFLNRILGMPVRIQNDFFSYFTETLNHVIANAKRNGDFDLGILDLESSTIKLEYEVAREYSRKHATGVANITLFKVSVDKGFEWGRAENIYYDQRERAKFYRTKNVRHSRQTVFLAVEDEDGFRDPLNKIYKPNYGYCPKKDSRSSLESLYMTIPETEAMALWDQQYTLTKTHCLHTYWYKRDTCYTKSGSTCDRGCRLKTYYVLSGAVLLVWTDLEAAIAQSPKGKLQMIRITTPKKKIIGVIVPSDVIAKLHDILHQGGGSSSVY